MKTYKRKLLNLVEYIFKPLYRKIYNELSISIRIDQIKRFGNISDGGYIIDVSNEYSTLLSFGIAQDVSFEKDFSNYYPSAKIICFDPSVDSLPEPIMNSYFYKLGVAKNTHLNYLSLTDIVYAHKLDPKLNNIIKMDIEGFEWEVIEHSFESLKMFDNFIAEFHFYERPRKPIFLFPFTLYKRLQLLRKLKKHFYIYNVHFNNGPGIIKFKNFLLPQCVEISFLNKTNPKLRDLNAPNNPSKPDNQMF